ncbi:TetR family transcriptional regulator [Oceanobacillus zhaokaii]|uniref:TetR family transcriptional regulator n=1 Tax=Oceanobacillus zhaokaii TaxID=2052660 RepID=A0A345PJQ0_9BACI|nr:TetR/AcrR family transcriptional regulator [Oceanobacillus zhaokaii]AXI10230.1 TetR family transcriptional regulator [Oceanobacillus zhaokaii]
MKDEITKQSILLFEKKGFSTTSIQDIVNALGVTKGTFYYYFSSKEQLLMDIHDDYITKLLELQKKIIHKNHRSQKEKLIEIIRLLITDIVENGPSARVFFREMRHLDNKHNEIIKQKRENFRINVERIVQEGIEKKEFHNNLRADMVSFGIVGITNWSYNWYKADGEVSPEELVIIYSQMIFSGIDK